VYPCASPGGWHLLGRAPAFRAFGPDGATLAVGDRVRFRAADRVAEPPLPAPASRRLEGPHLVVSKAAGPAILVDGGRVGHMHEGVPGGGPLVPDGLARANAALGNEAGACGIEIYGALEITASHGRVTIADDGLGARVLREGERATVATGGEVRARYLAVPGGFDVPVVLGARCTLLVASLGGLEGRALRRGDTIAPLATREAARTSLPGTPRVDADPIPIVLGPDTAPPATIDAITRATFRIAPASDRTGTRLDGPTLETFRAEHASGPMIRGAIELTPKGLIVLGPDHPTTGGYPVVAVVGHAGLARLFARPIGSDVRFVVSTSSG
jgi:allophanate hydrolase subunit 2